MKTLTCAVATAAILSAPVSAGLFSRANPVTDPGGPMPPEGYQGQWWTHPSGCEYSRAGRPGEIVWYVIINSVGRKHCPVMIVQKAWPGAYDGLGEG